MKGGTQIKKFNPIEIKARFSDEVLGRKDGDKKERCRRANGTENKSHGI